MKEFELDKDTKEMLTKISALSSIKADVIKQIWEFTAVMWYLQISETPDKTSSINIPFFGKVGVKFKNDKLLPDGQIQSEIDAFAAPTKEFANMVGDIYSQSKSSIIEYIQNTLIKNTLGNCREGL